MTDSSLLSLLQCPHCRRSGLTAADATFRCASCATEYPSVGGIPWLFANPGQALGEWRNRLALYLEEFGTAARAADVDRGESAIAVTRERVGRLADGYREQQRLVTELLKPLALAPAIPPNGTLQALATRLPLSQDLHSYYANLHRDWAWGDEENARSAELVTEALARKPERVLVLGAGASRLAYDLHEAGGTSLTVALDLNPLLLLAAQRLLAGESVSLYEFPLAPRSAADVAVRRELRAPTPVRAGFELVFADAWQAPFKPQSFDAVITPWLVDIVDLDFASVAAHVNRLLAVGGRWVNFGSLAFPWRHAALRLAPEELTPVLADGGFDVVSLRDSKLPYMRSPASRHSRIEEVVVFAADKARRSPREPAPAAPPAWLVAHELPVPRTQPLTLAADASRIQAVLLALVDGSRSINQLVSLVSEQGLLPPDQARSAICGLLDRLTRSAEKI